jgi:hypothetical protein
VFVAALILLLSSTSVVQAAILMPEQIGFSANDLEGSFTNDDASAGAGSTSSRNNSQPAPSNDESEQKELLGLLHANLPSGGGSSAGSSSSSSGGSANSGAICWSAVNTIATRDDAPLGRLAEEHGLSLPDPPGTDLLRPPRP